MANPISRAESTRTRPLPERGQGLPSDPGVRTPTDGLLVDLGFDPPTATKLVSEVGCKAELGKSELASQQECDDDNELMEASLFDRDYKRHTVRPEGVASAGPGIPHIGALWSDSPSPVVLFRGSRTAPVQRGSIPAHEIEAHFNSLGHDGDLIQSRVNLLGGDSNTALERNKLPNRASKFQALMENVTHQLHTLGYDWADVRDYHRAATTQGLSTPAESEAGPLVPADEAGNSRPGVQYGGHGHPVSHTAAQPLYVQRGNGQKVVRPVPVVASQRTADGHMEKTGAPEFIAVEQCQEPSGRAVEYPVAIGSKHPAKKNIMKPQIFDGREPVHSFLAHFEVCAKFNGWTEEDKVSWLQWSLKGRAQQLLWDLSPSQPTSYDDLASNLKQRFGSENQCEVYKLELRNRRRGARESLSDLMQDIRRLMVLAYSAETSDMWESVAINAFLEALDDPDLALEVRKRGTTTLDAAYRDALLLEGFVKTCVKHDQVKGKGHVRATVDKNADLQREVEELRSRLKQQENNHKQQMEKQGKVIQQLQQKNPASTGGASHIGNTRNPRKNARHTPGREGHNIVCYACSQPGHFRRDCPYQGQQLGFYPPPMPSLCRNCGQPGHVSSECNQGPVDPSRGNNGQTVLASNSCHITGSRSAYLPAKIFGRKRWCLLDTGSEVSVVPARYVPPNDVRVSTRTLNAANGTSIPVTGETNLVLNLGDQRLNVPCLVSEHVDEILLGLTFLEENQCVWQFANRKIEIAGREYPLFAHKLAGSIRRITVQDNTTISPRCQQTVMAHTVYRTLNPSSSEWATKPFELVPGVRVARTMVADTPSNVGLQVINTNDYEVQLSKGMSLGHLEEVVPIESKPDGSGKGGDCHHISNLIEGIDEAVPPEQKANFKQLLIKYQTVFSKGDHDLGCATAVKHRIDTGGSRPVRQSLRRQPPHYVSEIDRQLKEWESEGKITPSQSEWASNIVIVKKKDGSLRFCVDYRQLNERTVKDSYPLPRIDDCLDCLGGAKWFSTMDLRSGYHQVAMDERDKDKTTFVTRRGTYCFNVMPFGLCNAPATFQRLMDCTMRGLNYEVCLIYLDDIIVFSPDVASHLERLETVLARLQSAGLKLKPDKCSFLQSSVDFLGYKVSGCGIETDQSKIDAVLRWPVPVKLREVRSFLGLCGYYRRFVPNFSAVAAPLHAMTKKNATFCWTAECQKAFDELKHKLSNAPVLALPRDDDTYVLDTDASDHGIGAVLSQVQNGEEKVISYASRLYSTAERRYCVTRKELLAVVFFLKQFRRYLLG